MGRSRKREKETVIGDAWVYFLRSSSNGFIKIGVTRGHPSIRFANIQSFSPVPLENVAVIRGSLAMEREIHARFSSLRRHGEWFHPGDELMDFIADHGEPWPDRVGPSSRSKPKKTIANRRTDRDGRLRSIKLISYQSCEPKPLGDMHERMKYLIELIRNGGPWDQDRQNAIHHAIWDLQTEVESHEPVHPPFGKRLVKL